MCKNERAGLKLIKKEEVVLPKIAEGGSMGTVTRGLWPGYYCQVIEYTKSSQPESGASQWTIGCEVMTALVQQCKM